MFYFLGDLQICKAIFEATKIDVYTKDVNIRFAISKHISHGKSNSSQIILVKKSRTSQLNWVMVNHTYISLQISHPPWPIGLSIYICCIYILLYIVVYCFIYILYVYCCMYIYCCYLFTCLLAYWLVCLLDCVHTYSHARSLICISTYLLGHLFTYLLVYLPAYLLTYPLTCLLTQSLTYLMTDWLTDWIAYLLT